MSVNSVFGHGAGRDQLPESLGAKLSAASLSIVFATDASLPIVLTNDTNWGVVGANTLRTAAEIGNATGAADFNAGNASAQTLRVVVASNQAAIPASQSGTWTVQPGNTANTTAWKVDGSGVTQPVSAASLPLPTGAATAAKQPALGTAGSASADVISVQGVASMTALKVDGSAVTQPVSGTVTGNQGTAAVLASAWPIKLTDGTNTAPTMDVAARAGFHKVTDGTNTVAVKAASTAAAATDTALVVAISPNNSPAISNLPTTVDTNTGIAGASTVRTVHAGRDSTKTTIARNDYTVTNVSNSAYTQLIASTANQINKLYVFDSSGAAMIVATGILNSEVDRLYIPPGGSGAGWEIDIPASTRVSIKSLDTTSVSTGQMIFVGLP
jgi:hypothetical protein